MGWGVEEDEGRRRRRRESFADFLSTLQKGLSSPVLFPFPLASLCWLMVPKCTRSQLQSEPDIKN